MRKNGCNTIRMIFIGLFERKVGLHYYGANYRKKKYRFCTCAQIGRLPTKSWNRVCTLRALLSYFAHVQLLIFWFLTPYYHLKLLLIYCVLYVHFSKGRRKMHMCIFLTNNFFFETLKNKSYVLYGQMHLNP